MRRIYVTQVEQIVGFDWDVGNVGHILRHSVTPREVEEAVVNRHIVFPAMPIGNEERRKLFGKLWGTGIWSWYLRCAGSFSARLLHIQ